MQENDQHLMLGIAILGGTGNEGSALAKRWAFSGYRVFVGSRSAEKAEARVKELNEELGGDYLVGLPNEEAAKQASIVVLTVPYSAHKATLESVKEHLQGKILIDVTVPLQPPAVNTVYIPEGKSACLEAQAMLGDDVKVIAAFQNVSHTKMDNPETTVNCDVLVCGDDADAKNEVLELVKAVDMRGIDAGPLANAVVVEGLTAVLIHINKTYKVKVPGYALRELSKILNNSGTSFQAVALESIPLIYAGDNLVSIILEGLDADELRLQPNDVLVISSKIVSKAEGCNIDLSTVKPSSEALQLANETNKDARILELVLRESQAISRKSKYVVITQHRLGFVSANSGIDQSNVDASGEHVLLLPSDPDHSAELIRQGLLKQTGIDVGIVISDTHGRPFRLGNVGVAIGVAGIPALVDLRGQLDLFGRELQVSTQAYADLIASTAHLLCGEGDEGRPIVLLRGLEIPAGHGRASDLNRAPEQDLYL